MRWPSDHPLVSDGALATQRHAVDELISSVAPTAVDGTVLRHVAGRRAALLLEAQTIGRFVVRVTASPRARGNDRRLRVLSATTASGILPRPLALHPGGHVGAVSYIDGDVLYHLDDERLVAVSRAAGSALRRLHDCGAELDRAWTADDEIANLDRFTDSTMATLVQRIVAAAPRRSSLGSASDRRIVSAHRDCHPKQAVCTADGSVSWIDLDDAAMAPASLDLANFVAHLRVEAVIGRRSGAAVNTAVVAFCDGYGDEPHPWWVDVSLVRQAALATRRHQRPDWAAAIAEHVGDRLEHPTRAGAGGCAGAVATSRPRTCVPS